MICLVCLFCWGSICFADENEQEDSEVYRYYVVIYNDVLRANPQHGAVWADWSARAIIYFCQKWQVSPLLAAANFHIESNYTMESISKTGARGVAQLMPGTAKMLGITNIDDPMQNIEGGIMYLAQQLDTFRQYGDMRTTYAIAAYNAGPQAIKDYRGLPPYRETINHVERVRVVLERLVLEYNGI
ncbi:lytic transglycosylase domain-containing protein [Sporomusa sphaeroides]|nr:lytic transglycosylase domain-containing protein [Sporomusa sphaeroides]